MRYLKQLFSAESFPAQENPHMSFDLNATLGPVIDGMVAIIPSFTNFVVAMVPLLVTVAFVGFFVAFPEKILGMLKF